MQHMLCVEFFLKSVGFERSNSAEESSNLFCRAMLGIAMSKFTMVFFRSSTSKNSCFGFYRTVKHDVHHFFSDMIMQ